jgi:hypothetical protein
LDGFWRLPCCGNLDGLENGGGFALERFVWGIKEVGIVFRRDPGEEQRLDVERPIARGPGEALEAAGDVGGVGELAAAVAGKERGRGHK